MPNQHDYGLVVLQTAADGTQTLSVCAKVVDGQPVATTASYTGKLHINLHANARFTSLGRARVSSDILEVFADSAGVVHVRQPATA
ncbi:hypothetical protein AB0M46_33420 [Dactylosporangium sp. NPDC051485]|uniref:hypothetical protein n=1 Tax=Dactylosporangium sp. NPDC051485 TaxID=3154846 RepID=UPI00342918C4